MFDAPREHFEPEPPPDDDLVTRVMRAPGMKTALIELLDEAAQRLDVHSPVGPEDLAKITSDGLFRQRLSAVVEAVMFA
jgi:hypothetical protein